MLRFILIKYLFNITRYWLIFLIFYFNIKLKLFCQYILPVQILFINRFFRFISNPGISQYSKGQCMLQNKLLQFVIIISVLLTKKSEKLYLLI